MPSRPIGQQDGRLASSSNNAVLHNVIILGKSQLSSFDLTLFGSNLKGYKCLLWRVTYKGMITS